MADNLIGTINILRTHNGVHTAGDVITVFFDPDTDLFTVYKDPNGASPNAVITFILGLATQGRGSGVLEPYWSKNETGFQYQSDSTTITYFRFIQSFPFFERKTRPVIDTGVNDIVLGIESVTQASAAGVGDAQVVLTASGTNTPFQYSKDGITYQNSATFSSLFSAPYKFYARDSKGNIDTVEITIPVDSTPVETVTHDVKYRLDFYNIATERFNRIDILKRGYSGAITDVLGGADPIIISARAENGSFITDTVLISHEARISLISETFKQFAEFASADEYEYMVLYYIDDSAGKDQSDYNLRFRGYITPETYTEEYGVSPYVISFSAHDRIADLKNIQFYEGSVFDENLLLKNQPITGILKQAVIIDKALSRIKLNQGYRIAIDMWEESMTPSSTDTPLHNAYENTESYYDEENKADTCLAVIEKILKPYGAILFSYMGFFYIVKEEQLRTTSVSYVEYSTILGTGVSGSWNPRISFKSANNTNYWRFAGNHTLEYTRPVKNVNILAVGRKRKDTSITPIWSQNNIDYIDGQFNGFRKFELITNSNILSDLYFNSNEYGWILNPTTPFINSNSYIRSSQAITFTSIDRIKISFEYRTDAYTRVRTGLLVPPFPYLPLKWSLSLGTNYLQSDGTWDTVEAINQVFVDASNVNTGSFNTFSIEALMPDGYPTQTELNYDFRIYPVTIWEYDLEAVDASAAKTAMENIVTTTLPNKTRRIIRFTEGSEYGYFYYELRWMVDGDSSKNNLTEIKPADYGSGNRRRWISLGSWGESTTETVDTTKTKNIFKNVIIKTLPNGLEPPNNFGDLSIVSVENNIDIDVQLDHFDLTDQVVNDENIYINYTRRADGTPTTIWTRTGGVEQKSRQAHLKDRLYELYKLPRYRLNPNIYSDVEISILKHLYIQDDDGRIFALNGIEINPRTGQHSGEMIEIYQDNTPSAGDFNDDFDTDNDYF